MAERQRMRATICFVIAVGVATAWITAVRDRDLPVPAKRESVRVHVLPERAFVSNDPSVHEPTAVATSEDPGSDPGLSEFVAWKYRWLFEAVQESERQVLRAALLRREQLAVAVNTAVQQRDPAVKAEVPTLRSQLREADEHLRELVHPATFAEYVLLKDADAELYRLREYADGISNLAPLSPAQQRAVLFAKLMYKQQYQQLLADSGLETSDLPPSQRRYAFESVARELDAYRSNFLLQAQQALADEQQHALLQNYENTEFAEERAKLRLATLGE
jgi:hypothetical protein